MYISIAIATQTLELSFISAAGENVWKASTIYDKHDAAGYYIYIIFNRLYNQVASASRNPWVARASLILQGYDNMLNFDLYLSVRFWCSLQ